MATNSRSKLLRSKLRAVILRSVVAGHIHSLEKAIEVSCGYESELSDDLSSSRKSLRLLDFLPEDTIVKVQYKWA